MTVRPTTRRERVTLAIGAAVVVSGLWFAKLRPVEQRLARAWALRELIAEEGLNRLAMPSSGTTRLTRRETASALHVGPTIASAAGTAADHVAHVAQMLGVSVAAVRSSVVEQTSSQTGLVSIVTNWSASPESSRRVLDELEFGARPFTVVRMDISQSSSAVRLDGPALLSIEVELRTAVAALQEESP